MTLPELLVDSPRMLTVLRSQESGYVELTVFRSPWVRNTDPLFQKVLSEVESRCVTVVEKLVSKSEMMFGVCQEFVIRAWDDCPASDHFCCWDQGHVDSVFAI